MSYSITLSRYESVGAPGRTLAFRLYMTVTAADSLDPEIFLYQVVSATRSELVAVCTPADLERYPIGESDGTTPYFRLGYLDVLFKSAAEMSETYDFIISDVQSLLDTLQILDKLQGPADVTLTSSDA